MHNHAPNEFEARVCSPFLRSLPLNVSFLPNREIHLRRLGASFVGQSGEVAIRVNVSSLIHGLAIVKLFPFAYVARVAAGMHEFTIGLP
jgi:hypothetical protein